MAQSEPTNRGHREHIERDGIERQEVIYIDTKLGEVILLICPFCHLIETHCLHQNNSWNDDGTQLTCNLCGLDGT